MEIQNDSQLELFSQPNAANKNKSNLRSALTGYFRNYEKTVILIICFLISWVIIFTIGIEKGKNMQLERSAEVPAAPPLQQEAETNIEPVIKIANIKPETVTIKPEITEQQAQNPVVPVSKDKSLVKKNQKGRFTVQLASYQNKTTAQKEAQNLKKNGYTPLILTKGKYIVLCVGNFSDESKAKSILTKFKKQYLDSRIRRL